MLNQHHDTLQLQSHYTCSAPQKLTSSSVWRHTCLQLLPLLAVPTPARQLAHGLIWVRWLDNIITEKGAMLLRGYDANTGMVARGTGGAARLEGSKHIKLSTAEMKVYINFFRWAVTPLIACAWQCFAVIHTVRMMNMCSVKSSACQLRTHCCCTHQHKLQIVLLPFQQPVSTRLPGGCCSISRCRPWLLLQQWLVHLDQLISSYVGLPIV